MMGNHQSLLARLRTAKPDQPGWWMIERDDMDYRPAYRMLKPANGYAFWTPNWQDGHRFTEPEEAQRYTELHDSYYETFVRSHGMMSEYRNPDGPEAADVIEALEAALASVGRNPEGHDRETGHGAEHEHAVGEAETPSCQPLTPLGE